MSAIDVFSLRYRARIGSRQFDRELFLHDYPVVETEYRRVDETSGFLFELHFREEQRLREQAWRTVENANGRHVARDLLRKARALLADLYGQSRRIHPRDLHRFATQIIEHDVAWLFRRAEPGQAGPRIPEPFSEYEDSKRHPERERFILASNVVVFDFIEAFFDLLPSDEQLEFSRDLNHRLNSSGSPWFFQLGRWRRDDWPRERDGQFDMILFSLRERVEEERQRERNRAQQADVAAQDADGAYEEIGERLEHIEERSQETSRAVELAAELLFNADRLLNSDLLSPSVRHEAAVGEARAALDLCLQHFSGAAYGPFIDVERARDDRRGGLFGRTEKPRVTVSDQRLTSHEAAAVRIRQIGQALSEGGHGIKGEERRRLLMRAPLAEFMLRLTLFGVEANVQDVDEDFDGRNDVKVEIKKEVAAYSAASAGDGSLHLGAKGFSHHAGGVKLPLSLKRPETARLAVETLAKLCLYATGARVTDEFAQPGSFDPMTGPVHPRAGDMERQRRRAQLLMGVFLLMLTAASLGSAFLLGALFGPGVLPGL